MQREREAHTEREFVGEKKAREGGGAHLLVVAGGDGFVGDNVLELAANLALDAGPELLAVLGAARLLVQVCAHDNRWHILAGSTCDQLQPSLDLCVC